MNDHVLNIKAMRNEVNSHTDDDGIGRPLESCARQGTRKEKGCEAAR